jgi:hypothetical protein
MSKFIKLKALAQQTPASDTTVYVNVAEVIEVSVATENDRRIRKEINTLITLRNGIIIGTEANAGQIVEQIEAALL